MPAGPAVVYLLVIPEQQSTFRTGTTESGEVRIGGGLTLATVQIPADGVVERDFDLAQGFPASVTVSVLVNGEAIGGLTVSLCPDEEDSPTELETQTDQAGRAGPLRLYPGFWYLGVSSEEGWSDEEPAPFQVASAAELSLTIPIEVATGTVTCLDVHNGQPLAAREVWVSRASVESSRISGHLRTWRTDDEGRLELRLCTGDYLLQLGTDSPYPPDTSGANAGGTRLTWTLRGPATPEVRL